AVWNRLRRAAARIPRTVPRAEGCRPRPVAALLARPERWHTAFAGRPALAAPRPPGPGRTPAAGAPPTNAPPDSGCTPTPRPRRIRAWLPASRSRYEKVAL